MNRMPWLLALMAGLAYLYLPSHPLVLGIASAFIAAQEVLSLVAARFWTAKVKQLAYLGGALTAMAIYFQPGHWAMLGGLIFLIVIHELGHWFFARLFGFDAPVFSVGFGSSPRIVFGKIWGTEFQMTPWLIGGYVKIDPSEATFLSKPVWKRAVVMAAGVAMNVAFSLALMFALFATVGKREQHVTGVGIQDFSPTVQVAAQAGLQKGDQIVSVNGVPVVTPHDLKRELAAAAGNPAAIGVKRGAENLNIAVTPQNGQLGIMLQVSAETTYRKMGVLAAAGESLSFHGDLTYRMFEGLGMMVGLVAPPEGLPEGATDVHGVVAIVQIGSAAFDDGVYSFLVMLCLISMNLAIMNILPVPVLDGGHLLFLAVEKVRGKPVSAEVQGSLCFLFMILLFALMALGLFNDIFKPIG